MKSQKLKQRPLIKGNNDWQTQLRLIELGQNRILIRGYGEDLRTGERTPPAQSAGDISQQEQLIRQVTEKLARTVRSRQESNKAPKAAGKLGTILREVDKVAIGRSYLGWAQRTVEERASRLMAIIDELDNVADEITTAQIDAVIEKLHDKTISSPRSDKTAKTDNKFFGSIAAAARLYDAIRLQNPDLDLPVIDWPVYEKISAGQVEQVKSLPNKIRLKFANYLSNDHRKRSLAIGAALMFFCALRNAEACAITFGQIVYPKALDNCHDYGYGLVMIEYQIYRGARTNILKTTHAYRLVIIPHIVVRMIKEYREELRATYGEDVDDFPLVTTNDEDPEAFADPQELGKYVMEGLRACGLSEEYLDDALKAQRLYPDPIDDRDLGINTDFTSYVLRRECTTRYSTINGLSPQIVDCLIGHKRYAHEQQIQMSDAQLQYEVARALERFSPLPELSTSPHEHPIAVHADQQLELASHTRYTLCATEDVELELDCDAIEPESQMQIRYVAECDPKLVFRSRSYINYGIKGAPVLPMIKDAEEKSKGEEDVKTEEHSRNGDQME